MLRDQLAELNDEFEAALVEIRADAVDTALPYEELNIAPKKSDIEIERLCLIWTPWSVDEDGVTEPCFDSPET